MEIIRPGWRYDFMGKRWYFIGLTLVLLTVSIVSFIYPGPRWGTDFKGGTEIDVAFLADIPTEDLRAAVVHAGFESPDLVQVKDTATPHHYLIRVRDVSALTDLQKQLLRDRLCFASPGGPLPAGCTEALRAEEVRFSPGADKVTVRYDAAPDVGEIAARLAGLEGVTPRPIAGTPPSNCAATTSVCLVNERQHKVEIQLQSKGDQLFERLRAELGPDRVPERPLRVEWAGPKAGAQLRNAAMLSTGVAVFLIMVYLAVRFDMRFVPGAVISVVHDVGIALGAVVFTQREITLSTVAAVLMIAGYSMSDTVVVFDRVRENLAKQRDLGFKAIINLSISEMFSRTVISSGVTLLSLLMFLVWGTGVIKDFAFTLVVGIVVITYSSIYVAAPITEWIDRRFFGSSVKKARKLDRTRRPVKAAAVV